MATFCTKCGTQLPPDTQFCTACGTAVAPAPAATPAYAPPQYQAPQYPAPPAPYAQPYAQSVPPTPTGASAVKIILIIVGVFVGLGILGIAIFAFTIWRVSKSVHVNQNGSNLSINTPGGHMAINTDNTYTPAELGTDIYPGATSGHGSMKMDLPSGSMVTGIFLTSDPKDKVLAFYRDKLGSDASTMDTNDTAIVTLKRGENEAVMVTITPNRGDNDSKTQISIVHTKKTGSN